MWLSSPDVRVPGIAQRHSAAAGDQFEVARTPVRKDDGPEIGVLQKSENQRAGYMIRTDHTVILSSSRESRCVTVQVSVLCLNSSEAWRFILIGNWPAGDESFVTISRRCNVVRWQIWFLCRTANIINPHTFLYWIWGFAVLVVIVCTAVLSDYQSGSDN